MTSLLRKKDLSSPMSEFLSTIIMLGLLCVLLQEKNRMDITIVKDKILLSLDIFIMEFLIL